MYKLFFVVYLKSVFGFWLFMCYLISDPQLLTESSRVPSLCPTDDAQRGGHTEVKRYLCGLQAAGTRAGTWIIFFFGSSAWWEFFPPVIPKRYFPRNFVNNFFRNFFSRRTCEALFLYVFNPYIFYSEHINSKSIPSSSGFFHTCGCLIRIPDDSRTKCTIDRQEGCDGISSRPLFILHPFLILVWFPSSVSASYHPSIFQVHRQFLDDFSPLRACMASQQPPPPLLWVWSKAGIFFGVVFLGETFLTPIFLGGIPRDPSPRGGGYPDPRSVGPGRTPPPKKKPDSNLIANLHFIWVLFPTSFFAIFLSTREIGGGNSFIPRRACTASQRPPGALWNGCAPSLDFVQRSVGIFPLKNSHYANFAPGYITFLNHRFCQHSVRKCFISIFWSFFTHYFFSKSFHASIADFFHVKKFNHEFLLSRVRVLHFKTLVPIPPLRFAWFKLPTYCYTWGARMIFFNHQYVPLRGVNISILSILSLYVLHVAVVCFTPLTLEIIFYTQICPLFPSQVIIFLSNWFVFCVWIIHLTGVIWLVELSTQLLWESDFVIFSFSLVWP